MNKSKQISTILLVGLFLLGILFFSLLITSLLLLVGITINQLNGVLTVICSDISVFIFSKKDMKKTLKVVVIGLVILISSICICGNTYDWSYDGNSYHKAITASLKLGWNPFNESFFEFAKNDEVLSIAKAHWYDSYVKGGEIFGAIIYSLTGNIESGKCFNIISIIATYCICYSLIFETIKLKKWQSAICAFLLVVNPISFSQVFTYYIDAYLWQMVLICLISLIVITLDRKYIYRNICYYLIFVSIGMALNIKFSGAIFLGIPCIIFFMYWVISILKKHGLTSITKKFVIRRFCLMLSALLFGIFVIGSNAYVVNLIRYGNLFNTTFSDNLMPQMLK